LWSSQKALGAFPLVGKKAREIKIPLFALEKQWKRHETHMHDNSRKKLFQDVEMISN
jgi:hypothetical protein